MLRISSLVFGSALFASISLYASDAIPVYSATSSPLTDPRRIELPYEIKPGRQFAANNCELAVKQFGVGSAHNLSFHARWLEARVKVDRVSIEGEQNARVLAVGAYAEFERRETSEGSDDPRAFFLGAPEQDGGSIFSVQVPALTISGSRRAVTSFAFFIDVMRANRVIERLWLTNGSRNFTLPEVFRNAPTMTKSIGKGTIRYVGRPSPIYNQLLHCAHL